LFQVRSYVAVLVEEVLAGRVGFDQKPAGCVDALDIYNVVIDAILLLSYPGSSFIAVKI
jgi:hypothetical protein